MIERLEMEMSDVVMIDPVKNALNILNLVASKSIEQLNGSSKSNGSEQNMNAHIFIRRNFDRFQWSVRLPSGIFPQNDFRAEERLK